MITTAKGLIGWHGPLAKIARKYAWSLPIVAVLGVTGGMLEGIGIGLLIPLIALLMTNGNTTGVPEPIAALTAFTAGFDPQMRVIALGAAVVVFILMKGMVQAANNIYIATLEGRIARDVRAALAKRLLELDYLFFLREDNSRITHILATDSWYVFEATRHWLALIPAVLAIVVTAAILAWLNLKLFIIAVLGALIIQAGILLLERRKRELGREVTDADLVLWNRMLALVRGMRVIRLFGQRARERDRFTDSVARLQAATLASQRLGALVNPTVDGLLALLFLAILIVGYQSGMSIPAATAFLVLLARTQPYALTITQSRIGIAGVRRAVEEVDWLLAQEPSRTYSPGRAPAPVIERPIKFDGVSYVYPNGNVGLHSATFEIRPGIATALIGRSGSGKTTLINLLVRLIDPQEGTITIGGQSIAAADIESWRSRIAVAGQDVGLIDGTIAENVAYGRPDASEAEIAEVAEMAGVTEFIDRLPKGYDTVVGEEGLRLSGGQRQRISLARALLRRPDLLILDEAMNAVDAISETEIMKLLGEHRNFKAALVISHRKSTLSLCEAGIVIEEGRVREAGPLASLAYFRDMSGETGRIS